MKPESNFIFFGSSIFSVIVLDTLEKSGWIPTAVVTTSDKPKGRGLVLTPTPVKEWAVKRNITVYDPEKLDLKVFATAPSPARTALPLASPPAGGLSRKTILAINSGAAAGITDSDFFLVASYGKIIPNEIINIPSKGSLNLHPSLLPKYRGASPLQSAILGDAKETGVTIIKMDEKMDHGPVVAQEKVLINEWPTYEEFEKLMAEKSAELLIRILPDWLDSKIIAQEQDHTLATFTKKINKENGLIDLNGDPYTNFRKIQAFHQWPQTYFFIKKNGKDLRVKITQASFSDGQLIIEKVIPESGREMNYADFLNRNSIN